MNRTSKPTSSADLNLSIDRFEASWKNLGSANIADFLPSPVDSQYRTILAELIRVDLEIRWKNGEQPTVEDYLRRFGDASFSPAEIEPLAFEEYRLRFQADPTVSPDEYALRLEINTSKWPRWSSSDQQSDEKLKKTGSSTERQSRLGSFPKIGSRFHGFDIVGRLGQGAFGTVFLARQEDLSNRFVALKVTEVSNAEPQSLARLQHTNIIPIYSLKHEGNLQSICMPFLGVATMRDLFQQTGQTGSQFRSGRELISTAAGMRTSTIVATVNKTAKSELNEVLKPAQRHGESMAAIAGLNYQQTVLWMVSRVADGLAYAHSRGIVHGDLKPANILISDDGEPLILDFHLAQAGQQTQAETLVGGTLPYMSARHLQSLQGDAEIDASCDVFSLGVILYEFLTGKLPYESQGAEVLAFEKLIQNRRQPARPIRQQGTKLSCDLASIVDHCLSPDEANRYHSARELHTDIENHLANLPLCHAPNRSLTERTRKWIKRHPKLSSGTSIAVVATIVIAVIGLLVASRLTHAAKIEIENQSTQFVESMGAARLPLVMRQERNRELKTAVEQAIEIVHSRTTADPQSYQARLDDLPTDMRQKETRELNSLVYWIAYRLLNLADAASDPEQEKQDLQRAVEQLDFVMANAKDQTPVPILQMKASVLDRLGQSESAKQLRQSIVPADSIMTIPERILEAAELRRNHREQAAIEVLEKLTGEQPDIAQAWMMMGQCYSELKAFDKAEICYSTGIGLDPQSPWGYFHRGVDYLLQGKFQQAKQDFDSTIDRDAEDSTSYLNRALAWKGMGELESAMDDLTTAIEMGAAETRAYYIRSQVLNQLDRKEEADQDFKTFLSLEPQDEVSWLSRGMAQMKINDSDAALSDFQSALKFDSRSINAFQNIATVEAEYLDRTEDAIEALSRIVELEPDDLVAVVTRGVLRARIGQRDDAMQDAKIALAKSRSADIQFRVAGIFALTSKRQDVDAQVAIDLLNKAVFQDPRLVLSRITTDSDLDSLREREDFKSLLQRLKSLVPKKRE